MQDNIHPYPNPNLMDLRPYEPGMSDQQLAEKFGYTGQIIKLASNENPYGPSPEIKELLSDFSLQDNSCRTYPYYEKLLSEISKFHQVNPTNVAIGNGSNDVLDLIARSFLAAKDEVILSEFSFSVFRRVSQYMNAKIVTIQATNYGHDLSNFLTQISYKTKIIWIANPNNPTGTFIDKHDLEAFIKAVPANVLIVLDEAYSEYLEDKDYYASSYLIKKYSNVIITKTFSKAYGLAGLRIGYAIANPHIIKYINIIRQPFNVNNFAIYAALHALQNQDYINTVRRKNREGLHQVYSGLKKLDLNFIKSKGNFVLAEHADASTLFEHLLAHGIIVRPLSEYGLNHHLRITIGTDDENNSLLQALQLFNA